MYSRYHKFFSELTVLIENGDHSFTVAEIVSTCHRQHFSSFHLPSPPSLPPPSSCQGLGLSACSSISSIFMWPAFVCSFSRVVMDDNL
jgi:hypothetical protein